MKRGTKPKPASLHRLHGTPSKKRLNREPVAPPGPLDVPPSEVAACAIASEIWRHTIATAPRGVLRPIDRDLLARLCITLAIGRRAIEELRTNGYMITSSTGTMLPSPWLGAFNRSVEQARKLAAELGLPPTGRARLDFAEVTPSHLEDDDRTVSGMTLDEFIEMGPNRTVM